MGIRQHDIARAAEIADRVANAIVIVVVEANAGGGDVLQQRRLDVPMVVETLRHVELEARRGRPHHAAAGMHAIDLFADPQRILDAQQGERVLVRDEQHASAIGHISTRLMSCCRP
jgi:hypothetical protein